MPTENILQVRVGQGLNRDGTYTTSPAQQRFRAHSVRGEGSYSYGAVALQAGGRSFVGAWLVASQKAPSSQAAKKDGWTRKSAGRRPAFVDPRPPPTSALASDWRVSLSPARTLVPIRQRYRPHRPPYAKVQLTNPSRLVQTTTAALVRCTSVLSYFRTIVSSPTGLDLGLV